MQQKNNKPQIRETKVLQKKHCRQDVRTFGMTLAQAPAVVAASTKAQIRHDNQSCTHKGIHNG